MNEATGIMHRREELKSSFSVLINSLSNHVSDLTQLQHLKADPVGDLVELNSRVHAVEKTLGFIRTQIKEEKEVLNRAAAPV